MNERLIKEARDLLPTFVSTLVLLVLSSLIWDIRGVGIGTPAKTSRARPGGITMS